MRRRYAGQRFDGRMQHLCRARRCEHLLADPDVPSVVLFAEKVDGVEATEPAAQI